MWMCRLNTIDTEFLLYTYIQFCLNYIKFPRFESIIDVSTVMKGSVSVEFQLQQHLNVIRYSWEHFTISAAARAL